MTSQRNEHHIDTFTEYLIVANKNSCAVEINADDHLLQIPAAFYARKDIA